MKHKFRQRLIFADWLDKYFVFSIKEPRSIGCTAKSRKPADCLIVVANYIPPSLLKRIKRYEDEIMRQVIDFMEDVQLEFLGLLNSGVARKELLRLFGIR